MPTSTRPNFRVPPALRSPMKLKVIIRATDVNVCSNRLIPEVLHEWREPRHEVFEQRNVWSLFNAFTEFLKVGNLANLHKRTEALHSLLDTHAGLSV